MPQPNLFDLDPEQVSGGPGSARPEIEVDEAVVSSKYQFLKVETSVPTRINSLQSFRKSRRCCRLLVTG
jgi:hypothetical protein